MNMGTYCEHRLPRGHQHFCLIGLLLLHEVPIVSRASQWSQCPNFSILDKDVWPKRYQSIPHHVFLRFFVKFGDTSHILGCAFGFSDVTAAWCFFLARPCSLRHCREYDDRLWIQILGFTEWLKSWTSTLSWRRQDFVDPSVQQDSRRKPDCCKTWIGSSLDSC